MITVDTSLTRNKYTETKTVYFDFEKISPDKSSFLSKDQLFKLENASNQSSSCHLSGNYSLAIPEGQYAGCSSFNVNAGDILNITYQCKYTERPVGVVVCAPTANFFERSSEAIVNDYGNGWKKVHLRVDIPIDYPFNNVKFCFFYWGKKIGFVDDLCVNSYKNKINEKSGNSGVGSISKFILKTSENKYVSLNSDKNEFAGNLPFISNAEVFEATYLNNGKYTIKTSNGKYIYVEQSQESKLLVRNNQTSIGDTFEFINIDNNQKIHIKTSTGKFVCADRKLGGLIICNRNVAYDWETFEIINKK